MNVSCPQDVLEVTGLALRYVPRDTRTTTAGNALKGTAKAIFAVLNCTVPYNIVQRVHTSVLSTVLYCSTLLRCAKILEIRKRLMYNAINAPLDC